MKPTAIQLLIITTAAMTALIEASVINFSFTASVVELDRDSVDILNIGDTVSGTFYYSTNLVDSESSPTYGFYDNFGDLSLSGFTFTFGGLTYSSGINDHQIIIVSSPITTSSSGFGFNLFFDSGGSSELSMNVLQPNYFGSDALPTLFNLSDFDNAQIEFSHDNQYVRATLINIIPEPSGFTLISTSLILILTRRKRTRRFVQPATSRCVDGVLP